MRYAILEECTSRTEDEAASKFVEANRGAISQVAGSRSGHVFLSGFSGQRVFGSVLYRSV